MAKTIVLTTSQLEKIGARVRRFDVRKDPKPGEMWRHCNWTGETPHNEIVAVCKSSDFPTLRFVVYRGGKGGVWSRPIADFMGTVSGHGGWIHRFERIEGEP
jgi:hypothetical protein